MNDSPYNLIYNKMMVIYYLTMAKSDARTGGGNVV